MLGIFSGHKLLANDRNGISRSISLPLRNESSAKYTQMITNYSGKFYNVIRDYYMPSEPQHLCAQQGALVQVMSHDQNSHMCYACLVSDIGSGFIPTSYLQENVSLNKSCAAAPSTHTLMDLTPPISPSTINSKTFSTASTSRSLSTSSTETLANSIEPSILEFFRIISIDNVDNRLCYKVQLKLCHQSPKIQNRHYNEFYSLHCKLLSIERSLLLPCLPLPMTYNDRTVEGNSNKERIDTFNGYLDRLRSVMERSLHGGKEILNAWLVHSTMEAPAQEGKFHIKVKAHFKGDCYAMKCPNTVVRTLSQLEKLIRDKIKALPQNRQIKITAKIDGWYIVNLSNEATYQETLLKTWKSQRLVLEVSLL